MAADGSTSLASQAGNQSPQPTCRVARPDAATPDPIATGQQKIYGIKCLLDKGEMTFPAAAVRYSDSPNALEGGDLGWRSLDEILAAFANTIRTLQKGQVIGPIRGPSGFQLLQLVDMRSTDQAAAQSVTQYRARPILVREAGDGDAAAAKARLDTLGARIASRADSATGATEKYDNTYTKDT